MLMVCNACFEQSGGTESRTKPSVFDHESDSGLSGSLTDSGRALVDDDVDAAAAALSPASCGPGPPYSLTGSYCLARAADDRRARLARTTSLSNGTEQRPCRRTRSTDKTILQLPSYDTYVWSYGIAAETYPLQLAGSYSATSNDMKLVHSPLMGGLLHLVQRGADWAGRNPPRLLLAVPNVTARPSTASVPQGVNTQTVC